MSSSPMLIWPSSSVSNRSISTTTSWIFTATPYIVFASMLAAGLLRPHRSSPDAA